MFQRNIWYSKLMQQLMNIWFNRTYDTNYWIIKDLQKRSDDVYTVQVYATHTDPTSPVLQAADHVSLEPVHVTEEEYIEWCLQYCAAHGITTMVPVRFQFAIMRNKARFMKAGVTLIASSADTVHLFDDKNITYQKASQAGVSVPPWGVAHDVESFQTIYNDLRQDNKTIIIKPVHGVGAEGFYILTENSPGFNNLLKTHKTHVNFRDVIQAYNENETDEPQPIMVMPWLDDPEISVDCLTSPDGELLRAVSRTKAGSRLTQFSTVHDKILDQVRKLADNFGLRYMFNAQFRWYNGEPVLLEVNTRVSGGLFSVLEYTHENFVWEAVKLAYDISHLEPDLSSTREGSYIPLNTSIPAKMLAL